MENSIEFAAKNYGENGQQCQVDANFASIEIKKDIIYHYTIEIEMKDHVNNENDKRRNQKDKKKQQKKLIDKSNFDIFNRLIEENRNLFKSLPAFDCKTNIYSPTRIDFDGDRLELNVRIRIPEKRYPKTFNIVLIKQDKIDFRNLLERDIKFAGNELHALNVIINHASKYYNYVLNSNVFPKYMDLLKRGREMENVNFDIGDLKYGRFGHRCTVRLTENGPQLCIDRVASVFNKGGSLIKIIEEFCTILRGRNQNNNNSRASNSREDRSEQYRGGLKNAYNRERSRDNSGEQRVRINRNFTLNDREKKILSDVLKGLEFEVNHLKTRPKFKIFKLTRNSVAETEFDLKDKENNRTERVAVRPYFERTYKDYCSEKLTDNGGQLFRNLPCVQVNQTNPTYYPLEVVEICHDQYFRKKLNSTQQAIMAKKCGLQRPAERFADNKNQLRELVRCSSKYDRNFLSSFGISIGESFKTIMGRILEIPILIGGYVPNSIGDNGKPKDAKYKPEDAKWKPKDTFGFRSKFIDSDFRWGVYNLNRAGNRINNNDAVNLLIANLSRSARQNEITLPDPHFTRHRQASVMDEEFFKLIESDKKDRVKFLLILIPPNFDELYYKIKFFSECKVGIITQCISHGKSGQYRDMSYCENVLLKINSKLGGVNNMLFKENKIGFLSGKTMIMGFNVNHASREDRIQNYSRRDGENSVLNSIASVVATYDSKMVNYHSVSVIQEQTSEKLKEKGKNKNEIVELEHIVKELFNKFHARNDFYPERVVVFRDGLNDGQFKNIMPSEIASMKKAFGKLNEATRVCKPKITYIVCQKKHNTRFLPKNSKDALGSGNVKPGFVVDREIVSNFNEFYLCSHYGGLGTSKPTRYIVLHDESKFTGDQIQQATYNLSFLFPRCSQAVSICPPILYAQFIAKRTRFYIANLDEAGERDPALIRKIQASLDPYSNVRVDRVVNYRTNASNYDELFDWERKELNDKIKVRKELQYKMYFL